MPSSAPQLIALICLTRRPILESASWKATMARDPRSWLKATTASTFMTKKPCLASKTKSPALKTRMCGVSTGHEPVTMSLLPVNASGSMPLHRDSTTIRSFMDRAWSLKFPDQVYTRTESRRLRMQSDPERWISLETSTWQSFSALKRSDSDPKALLASTMGQERSQLLAQAVM